ncbi:MAG: hypothetical protein COB61_011770 [Thiotrichales bacterium]|nr:hypothetical protein [Thiotrichales bacterium]
MILKGNQRGGGRQMALHLLNAEVNEHVNVHEVRGFMANDVLGAFNEIHAISKGTKCTQFMYSLSLNPPQDESVSIETFEKTLDRIEKKLGLEDQPRVIVFHEKEGRRHAHCVWSRLDTQTMTAKNMSHDRKKLGSISKFLFLEHGWQLPEGFKDRDKKNPLNYTRAQWQQAARIGRRPADIKRELQECWSASDSKKSFESALRESGYFLAKGDRRGYVCVDIHGEVYSLSRQLGQKKKALEARLGKAENLPAVAEAKSKISNQLSGLFTRYNHELKAQHQKDMRPLLRDKQEMTTTHRTARADLNTAQDMRWQGEEQKRTRRIRKGFKGFVDKLNGRYWKNRRANERETYQANIRDRKEQEELINKQLVERQNLQVQINLLRGKQEQERAELIRDLSHAKDYEQKKGRVAERSKSRAKDQDNEIDADDLENDFDPEL